MSGGEKGEKNLDPYEFYMRRRSERFRLSMARVSLGAIFGLLSSLTTTSVALVLFAMYVSLSITLGVFASKRAQYLRGGELYYVGLVSGLAAYGLGLILGSAI